MHVHLTCKNEEDLIKNEGARVVTTFIPLLVFPCAQWQVTPQSVVGSGRILNSPETLWCKDEEDSIKNEGDRASEWPQDYMSIFFRRSKADNSAVSGRNWPKFKLIQAFMHVLYTCKNEEDPVKNEVARVATRFLPI